MLDSTRFTDHSRPLRDHVGFVPDGRRQDYRYGNWSWSTKAMGIVALAVGCVGHIPSAAALDLNASRSGSSPREVIREAKEETRSAPRSTPVTEPAHEPATVKADKEKDEAVALFRKTIQPALKQHCFECHSKEASEVKGELLLDSREGLRRGGPNGPAVVPGDVEASFLMRAIRYKEDDYKMPPRGRLDDDLIRDFETWIKKGAEDGR